MIPSQSSIVAHLHAQYAAWEAKLYPRGRRSDRARLEVLFEEGDSAYSRCAHMIMIRIPEGNMEDLSARIGHISTVPDRWRLTVSEIELLHEMMHERQFVELASSTSHGEALFAKLGPGFPGPGHDELFYSAIAISAKHLGVTAEELVANL